MLHQPGQWIQCFQLSILHPLLFCLHLPFCQQTLVILRATRSASHIPARIFHPGLPLQKSPWDSIGAYGRCPPARTRANQSSPWLTWRSHSGVFVRRTPGAAAWPRRRNANQAAVPRLARAKVEGSGTGSNPDNCIDSRSISDAACDPVRMINSYVSEAFRSLSSVKVTS